MSITGSAGSPVISGRSAFPVNKGALCVKGWTAGELLRHSERLTQPLIRNSSDALEQADWDTALDLIVRRLDETRDAHGADAVAVFGSGALTNEKAYLLGKFARVALGTANIDYNGRFCMSSAAAAVNRSLGLDRGIPFPLEDIRNAGAILLAGANIAETMPPFMQYFEGMRRSGGEMIVIDPRRSATAAAGTLHLQNRPGTDAAVANGILHVLIRDHLIDADYIARRTEGFDAVRAVAATDWPERVEQLTGVPQRHIEQAARTLGSTQNVIVLTGRGVEQQSQGVANVAAFINIALALGAVGTPGSGYGCITGQGNGQGGREHGLKADQLPGYRRIDDEAARAHVAGVWGVDSDSLPGPGKPAYELLESLGTPSGARALLVFGSNPVVSAPNASLIEQRLRSLDFLVVSDFFLSETARLADVVLPSAQWAEETGTMTNLEGRVVLRRQAFAAPDGVRSDLHVICDLAERLGKGHYFDYETPEDVFNELRRASAGGPADYSGITYPKIEESDGIFWPCPSEDHPGTARLFTESFPTPSGKARFIPVKHQPPAEEPDGDFPVFLSTGRVLAQYQSGTQTRRVAKLQSMAPAACVEMNPMTATRLRLTAGKPVRVTTRRGTAVFELKINHGIRPDTVFVPFHWGDGQSVNRLTNPALDPVSHMPEFKVCAARVEPCEGR
jgi:assimilatory nitrate reductase catalytic subunit